MFGSVVFGIKFVKMSDILGSDFTISVRRASGGIGDNQSQTLSVTIDCFILRSVSWWTTTAAASMTPHSLRTERLACLIFCLPPTSYTSLPVTSRRELQTMLRDGEKIGNEKINSPNLTQWAFQQTKISYSLTPAYVTSIWQPHLADNNIGWCNRYQNFLTPLYRYLHWTKSPSSVRP